MSGIEVSGDGQIVYVDESVSGDPALLVSGDQNQISIRFGTLSSIGDGPAIIITGIDNFVLVHSSIVESSGAVAILGSSFTDTVHNNGGTIRGDVVLGDGVDIFQNNNDSTLTGRVLGGDGNDILRTFQGTTSVSYFGEAGDDRLDGGSADDLLDGGADNDRLNGASGNDSLDGGDGDDQLDGGAGDDILEGGAGTDWVSYASRGVSVTVSLAIAGPQDTGGSNFDTLSGIENLAGSFVDDVLAGNDGANVIDGGLGADAMSGGVGDDTYHVDNAGDKAFELDSPGDDHVISSVSYNLTGQYIERLTLIGGASVATGNSLANTLVGNSGQNILDGKTGADNMSGGYASDIYYVDNVGDRTIELNQEGIDKVFSSVSYALTGQYIEELTLTGTTARTAIGNSLDNKLTGNSAANLLQGLGGEDWLNGGAGADRMEGGAGNDIYNVDNAGDTVIELKDAGADIIFSSVSYSLAGQQVEELTLTGSGALRATGNSLNNGLTGNAGNNVLDGGGGSDSMFGGRGNDIFYVDNAGDSASESAGEGVDHVISSASFSLGFHIEKLTLTGSTNAYGAGNNLANTIVGNAGHNIIDGGAGADSMSGGAGDDFYFVDNVGDKVIELSGNGLDEVLASVSYSLAGQYIERLQLSGTAAINATGNSLANTLDGNAASNLLMGLGGDDTIDGRAGADRMEGGDGGDSYFVDNAGDKVIELNGQGTDIVYSSLSHALGQYVEWLTLIGSQAINATGNSLDNILTGNDAANILQGLGGNDALDGAVGADRMEGGAGDDAYFVDNIGDRVVEKTGEGFDYVQSSVSFSLAGQFIEQLYLVGDGPINGTGNSLDNFLTGNEADNVLSGGLGDDNMNGYLGADYLIGGDGADLLDAGAGADRMEGGAGDDTYFIDNVGDVAVEFNGQGYDSIFSSISYSLAGRYFEALFLNGGAAINATGNGFDNVLGGNAGANTLKGDAGTDIITGGLGNDRLFGGAGNDSLTGEGGADRFYFDTALSSTANVDAILDFSSSDDSIYLDRSIFSRISTNGTLSASAFHVGASAQDAGDRIIYDQNTGEIFYDPDGSGAKAAILFATVYSGTPLTNADFIAVA